MSVLVVGSGNVDLVAQVERIPSPGETVLSTGFTTHAGGKGNNQATAAARAGAHTTFIGAFGDDDNGTRLLASRREYGVHPLVRTSAEPTGTAMITVARGGENAIVVNAGANATLTNLTEHERKAIADAAILLLQLEIPLDTVIAAAHTATGTVVLNAAPAQPLPRDLLDAVDLLVVNEHEAELLGGAEKLRTIVPQLVVTLGAAGAVTYTRETTTAVLGIRVEVVDTTGAGDTFAAGFLSEYARSRRVAESLAGGAAAAAECVGRVGAFPWEDQ